MLKFSRSAAMKTNVLNEKELIDSYKEHELDVKETIETYLSELKQVSFDNDTLKTMIQNNFENAENQLDSICQDIDSLLDVLKILESQEKVSQSEVSTYNKLFEKTDKEVKLIENFLIKSLSCLENVQITGKKKSITVLEECKKIILKGFSLEEICEEELPIESDKEDLQPPVKSIKKDFDFSSSDLLCFFPKKKNDNLVISTIQKNYTLDFKGSTASICIKDEDFNISLNTPGVQVSNMNSNNVIFVLHSGNTYTIITNNQIEIPSFIKISKISKNEDFLEITITCESLNIVVEDNIINFEHGMQNINTLETAPMLPTVEDQNESEEEIVTEEVSSVESEPFIEEVTENNNEVVQEANKKVAKKIPVEDISQPVAAKSAVNVEPEVKSVSKEEKTVVTPAEPKKQDIAPIVETQPTVEIVDNDTLFICDSSKKVILPYKVSELEAKLKKNKKYKTLKDVVDKEYTIPLETYNNPVKSRFREAFQLIKKKEHGSLKEAIGLGFELMFQSDLNPAVISACKDLDELDIYLDCLDDNQLDKFSCFKIEYNVPPTK